LFIEFHMAVTSAQVISGLNFPLGRVDRIIQRLVVHFGQNIKTRHAVPASFASVRRTNRSDGLVPKRPPTKVEQARPCSCGDEPRAGQPITSAFGYRSFQKASFFKSESVITVRWSKRTLIALMPVRTG